MASQMWLLLLLLLTPLLELMRHQRDNAAAARCRHRGTLSPMPLR